MLRKEIRYAEYYNNIFIKLKIIFKRRFNQNDRIPYGLMTSAILIAALIALCLIDTTNWSNSLFTCLTLIFLTLASINGIVFSSAIYAASMFPPYYTNAVLLGYITSGLLSCCVSVVNKLGKF